MFSSSFLLFAAPALNRGGAVGSKAEPEAYELLLFVLAPAAAVFGDDAGSFELAAETDEPVDVLHQRGAVVRHHEGLKPGFAQRVDKVGGLALPDEILEEELVALAVLPGAEGLGDAGGEGTLHLLFLGVPGFQLGAVPAVFLEDPVLERLVGVVLLLPFAADAFEFFKVGVVLHWGCPPLFW